MLLPIHVAAGGFAIVLGAVALIAKKGGIVHRRSGQLFGGAMLAMASSASVLGFSKGGPGDGNGFAGVVTAYFVVTAWLTVRPNSPWVRRFNIAALLLVIALAIGSMKRGFDAIDSTGVSPDGVPFRTIAVVSLVFGVVMMLAAIGDFRMLRAGALRGGPRLARHLWRMCFALFIAAGSFFSIEERVAMILPPPLTIGPVRALPIVLLFGTMFFWLWRVRRRRLQYG